MGMVKQQQIEEMENSGEWLKCSDCGYANKKEEFNEVGIGQETLCECPNCKELSDYWDILVDDRGIDKVRLDMLNFTHFKAVGFGEWSHPEDILKAGISLNASDEEQLEIENSKEFLRLENKYA